MENSGKEFPCHLKKLVTVIWYSGSFTDIIPMVDALTKFQTIGVIKYTKIRAAEYIIRERADISFFKFTSSIKTSGGGRLKAVVF
jgi:hypothetical protein